MSNEDIQAEVLVKPQEITIPFEKGDALSKSEILVIIAAAPALVVAIGKWLIQDYLRATKELRAKELNEVKKDINNIGQKVRDNRDMMKDFNNQISSVNIELGKLNVHIDNLTKK